MQPPTQALRDRLECPCNKILELGGWFCRLVDSVSEMEGVDDAHICTACGIQFSPAKKTPELCPICVDDRQGIPRCCFSQQLSILLYLQYESMESLWLFNFFSTCLVDTSCYLEIPYIAFLSNVNDVLFLFTAQEYIQEAMSLMTCMNAKWQALISRHLIVTHLQYLQTKTFSHLPRFNTKGLAK